MPESPQNLVERMKRFSYHPQPVTCVSRPKAHHPLVLDLARYEDKLIQNIMSRALAGVYEPRFLDCSYAFRPGLRCHDLTAFTRKTIQDEGVNFILEADIHDFFGTADPAWIMKFLEHDVADKNYMRYIARFLKAGVMKEGLEPARRYGLPIIGQLSTVLTNVYLHYSLDLWFDTSVRPGLSGRAWLVRYADDFLFLFENEDDAAAVLSALPVQLGKFGLSMEPEKTRIFPFGRNDHDHNTFEFVGLIFYEGKTKVGDYRPSVRSVREPEYKRNRASRHK